MRSTPLLIPSRSGQLGILMLNNPKALHALNLEMCHSLQDVLQQWYRDDSVAAILVQSNATKVPAFCAGGDVKQVYLSGLSQSSNNNSNNNNNNSSVLHHGQGIPGVPTAEFFRQEYYCNHMLATAHKPQISLWDGLVLGGGVGLSVHGKFRVATERTVWAMPETAIGLFPDVGSTYWMPRCQLGPGVANYLALTGTRLGARDLLDTGIASHYVPSSRLPELVKALELTTQSSDVTGHTMSDHVARVLMEFHQTTDTAPQLDKTAIEQAFGGDNAQTVEGIVQNLQGMEDTEFGRTTLETLLKMSPTSLKVTLEALRRGKQVTSITEALQMEFRLAQACMRKGSDFFEGIRAVLIDKDHRPVWNPATLAEVTDERVESYFAPIQHEWELPPELVVSSTSKSKL